VGGLIGLGAAGQEGFEIGAERGAEAVAERGGVLSEDTAWDVLEEIPPTPPAWQRPCATPSEPGSNSKEEPACSDRPEGSPGATLPSRPSPSPRQRYDA
jgi:hypothetical protein